MQTLNFDGKGHTYAVSDFHGRLDLYQAIAKYIQPEDRVICLGDCGDRGPKCWETLKAVYENPQFILLKGNHEDMLVNALLDYFDYPDFPYDQAYWLLCYNGGRATFEGLLNDNPETRDQKRWCKQLSELPDRMKYINKDGDEIILTHSGYAPKAGRIPRDVIWDRDHFMTKWPKDKEFEKTYLVHGHTPIELQISEWMPDEPIIWKTGAFWYCDGHKVNIDCGAVWNDQMVLLDLDNWDEHVFVGPNFKGDLDGEAED